MNKRLGPVREPAFREAAKASVRSLAAYFGKDLVGAALAIGRLGWHTLSPAKAILRIRSRYCRFRAESKFKWGHVDEAISLWKEAGLLAGRVNTGAFRLDGKTRLLSSNYVQAIGHLGLISLHLKMKMLGWIDPQTEICILAPRSRVANASMMDYWRGLATVIEDPAICDMLAPIQDFGQEPVSTFNLSEGNREFVNNLGARIETEWHRQGRPPLLRLTDAHRQRGMKQLEALMGRPVDKFIAVHVRSRGFHSADYDDSVRNSEIETYLQAFERITKRGYVVVRMGDTAMPMLPAMEHVIDYAHSPARSDWMDVFLCAQAAFMICTQSGPNILPDIFGVPKLGLNWAPPAVRPFTPTSVFIPKLLSDAKTGDILPFSDQVAAPAGYMNRAHELARLGIAVVDNTVEEITDAVEEMLDRIEGKWVSDPQHAGRMQRYDAICAAADTYTGGVMGSRFLAKYQSFLE
jgi:putative glycosyltransferase (TIGR04372 family)